MTPRPGPTTNRQLDTRTLRLQLKQLLPGDLILDKEEEEELLDLSNATSRANVLRLGLVRAALGRGQRPRTLSVHEWGDLISYVTGTGERPSFALLATPEGHYHGLTVLRPDEDPLRGSTPGPAEDPGEPGRYVQPSGRFALPGADGFQPDRR
jgi:hypothetical protein